jgi:cysteine desulfurase family protein (TIGR01976 family)
MVDRAIDAMTGWMRSGRTANEGGAFPHADASVEIVESARDAVASMLGADARGVAFGPSMTSLTMAFSGAAGRALRPGDEIVCTRLDHDANVRPWLIAAERAGARVRFAEPVPGTLELPASAVEAVLSDRTRWVAVTAASNAVGTVPDLPGIVTAARRVGARVYVDAVHASPHRPHRVTELGVDALACSAYKWFGPHIGVLCARPELLAELTPDKLRPSSDGVPQRWELGTLPFESLAGVRAAAEYVQSLSWDDVRSHEDALLDAARSGLAAIGGVTLYGDAADRTPTLMFNVEGRTAREVAAALAEREIAVWDGNYYAWELERHLGLAPDGAVRAGFVHYNDATDAQRLLAAALDGLGSLAGVTLHGAARDRAPTLMFSVAGRDPEEVAAALAAREIAVWHGNYYAWELERHLGLEPAGAVRAGFVHYNDEADAERLLAAVADLP